MSQENVEGLVQETFAAFGSGDFEAVAPFLHPDLEIRPALVEGLEGTTYRGVDGMRQFWADINATWAEFRIEPTEFRHVPDGVLVLGRVFARGRETGIPLESSAAWLAGLRDGRLVTFQSFTGQVEALEAAGLRE